MDGFRPADRVLATSQACMGIEPRQLGLHGFRFAGRSRADRPGEFGSPMSHRIGGI